MKLHHILFIALLNLTPLFGAVNEPKLSEQGEYERDVQAVVRNKYFYKEGRLEGTVVGGLMPYDSVVNNYMVTGRATWHLSDHYGWEIVDALMGFPSVTAFTTNLVTEKKISNLQLSKIKYSLTSNFLLSPFYGKIRFFGSQILFFDVYVVLGGGMANTETLKLGANSSGVAQPDVVVRTGFEPVVDFGIGFKIFVNNFLGIVIDLRDYLVYSETYGSKSLKSNYTVMAGLSFFLPNF